MFVRRVAGVLAIAIGLLPTLGDASLAVATQQPISYAPIVRRAPIMSVAERLKPHTVCAHGPAQADALVPHTVVGFTPPTRFAFFIQPQTSALIHPQDSISHAPQLPASHRIRAPSMT